MKKINIINGHEWKHIFPNVKNYDVWASGFYCSDGDGVELYIEKDKSGFELSCFSGIGVSKIYIDLIDFGVFYHAPNKIENFLDNGEPFVIQCLEIADYLCSKFCEYKG